MMPLKTGTVLFEVGTIARSVTSNRVSGRSREVKKPGFWRSLLIEAARLAKKPGF